MHIKLVFPEGHLNMRIGTTWQHGFGSPMNPLPIGPEYLNSYARLCHVRLAFKIASSHKRVTCLIQRHQFLRGASRQERWRLNHTHSYMTTLNFKTGKWQTRCPNIACYSDEKQHVQLCLVMCVAFARQAPALRFSSARSTP